MVAIYTFELTKVLRCNRCLSVPIDVKVHFWQAIPTFSPTKKKVNKKFNEKYVRYKKPCEKQNLSQSQPLNVFFSFVC